LSHDAAFPAKVLREDMRYEMMGHLRTFGSIIPKRPCSSLIVSLWMLGLASATMALAAPVLDSREYKVALAPAKFAGPAPAEQVAELWEKAVKPAIGRLDPRSNGKPRFKESFDGGKTRRVVFRDTTTCALRSAGFALRERAKLKDGKAADDARLTLKLRAPDLFIVDSANLEGSGDASTKLEEDIVPFGAAAGGPSMRSLYSRSVNQDIGGGEAPDSVRDTIKLYPGLENELIKAGVAGSILDAALAKGPPIRELVFEGALVDLGGKVDAEFALTLWYAFDAPPNVAPLIAELSYRYETDKGDVSGAVARRALVLFQALQTQLGDWASAEHETKTALGLPACE
jgi:hypothetical protein